jgi:hypothetical protein
MWTDCAVGEVARYNHAICESAVDLFGVTGRFLALTAISLLKTPDRSPWPNAGAGKRPSVDVAEAVRAELSGVTEHTGSPGRGPVAVRSADV